ncbi:MAG: chitobiase/beta-hexosaminidase C-terminal domain-containing protein [Saprospirales bacterium]|nr:chitobiase/beta-hexosaminidase C-terminal domain-containing protein [Saprospirales bacterium]
MMSFLGRLHPLLVHLPIGILLLVFGLECLARWRGRADLRPAIRLALAAGALAAAASAGTGWWLAQQGGYDDALLQRHQWLGLSTVALAVLAWWRSGRPGYFPLLTGAMLALTAAGHFGGSLTHGANYLFETPDGDAAAASGAAADWNPDAPLFATLVQPVLKSKCVSCHNAAKKKGGLRLDAPAFIEAGGKNGAVVAAGRPEVSPLLQRLLLPLHDDDHMPPAGKPQPSGAERRLLEWWIARGADFNMTLRAAALPADLEAALRKNAGADRNPVFDLPVKAAPAAALENLCKQLISATKLEADKPWLAISFAGQPRPAKSQWEALRQLRRQTAELDLAYTDFGAAASPQLAEFPHLVRLNLAHTAVQDAPLRQALPQLTYLEALNITGTSLSDAILEPLARLPRLKRLYAWQTRLTPEGIRRLKQQRPGLHINTGAQVDSTRLALRAPKLLYTRSFFSDTVHVALDYPAFKGVSLYYTLDEAASPTTQSSRYREPVVLRQTSHVRAFAAKEGWLPSPVVDAVLVKKKNTPELATLEKPPSPKYPAKGAPSLIDGQIGDVQGADTWMGYEGEHLAAILDLGKTIPVSQVFVHCLENNVSWIFKPAAVEVLTSEDGKTFRPQGRRQFAPNAGMGEQKTHLLECPLPQPVQARFVRVLVRSGLKNPEWHPGKGQKCWIFVDEIIVE